MLDVTFRKRYLPYCLKRTKNGGYVVLNRNYAPMSFGAEGQPAVHTIRMTKTRAKKLSCTGSDYVECIYLYADGSIPTLSKVHMEAYRRRLNQLAKIICDDPK